MVDIKELKNVTSSFSLLYVEDDKEIAQSFIAYLSKFFKEVVYAENGEEGLALYNQQEFDLVLTDINMPKMNGLEMAAAIKEINSNQNIIIVSAYSDIDKFVTSIKLGVDGYIIKPINYTDMNNLLFKIAVKIKKYRENDINTEQAKCLLAQISKNNSQLRQYTEVIDQVAVVSKTDLEGVTTYVNDFFCEVSGYTKDESIGINQDIIRHPDMAKTVYTQIWDTIAAGDVWKGSVKNKSKNGAPYFINATIIPLYDAANENINEYITIGFLTTQEENKKRDFKKKVMLGYQEFRKHSLDANKNIDFLNKEVTKLKEEMVFDKNVIQDLKGKNKKCLSQIKFYETEIGKKDEGYKKFLNNTNDKARSVTDGYKKAQLRIDHQREEIANLEKDNDLRKEEVEKLTTKLHDQSAIIHDLRDTIKNINTTEERNKEEKKKGHFWDK